MNHWARLKLWYRGCGQTRVPIPSLKGTKGNDQQGAESTQVLKCYVDKLQVQVAQRKTPWKKTLPKEQYLPRAH